MFQQSETDVILQHANKLPIDLDAIAADLSISVSYEPLGTEFAGKLERDRRTTSGFKITVNSDDPPMRQRFTLAHELAHFVMHRDLLTDGVIDNALYRSSLSDDYERQANRFAAAILLPAEAVRRAYRSEPKFGALADLFQVSTQAMRIRLKELRLA